MVKDNSPSSSGNVDQRPLPGVANVRAQIEMNRAIAENIVHQFDTNDIPLVNIALKTAEYDALKCSGTSDTTNLKYTSV